MEKARHMLSWLVEMQAEQVALLCKFIGSSLLIVPHRHPPHVVVHTSFEHDDLAMPILPHNSVCVAYHNPLQTNLNYTDAARLKRQSLDLSLIRTLVALMSLQEQHLTDDISGELAALG